MDKTLFFFAFSNAQVKHLFFLYTLLNGVRVKEQPVEYEINIWKIEAGKAIVHLRLHMQIHSWLFFFVLFVLLCW